jgi:hypothetical protein
VIDKHKWAPLGIAMTQAHNLAEMQKTMHDNAPDVILIAETLPETLKAEIRSKITNVPCVTIAVPMDEAGGQPGASNLRATYSPGPAQAAYEQAMLNFEEAVFDAVQKIIPAGRPVYVSLTTL